MYNIYIYIYIYIAAPLPLDAQQPVRGRAGEGVAPEGGEELPDLCKSCLIIYKNTIYIYIYITYLIYIYICIIYTCIILHIYC